MLRGIYIQFYLHVNNDKWRSEMKIKLLILLVCVLLWFAEYRQEIKEIMAEYVLPKGEGGEKHD